jgi:hypothetical protein
MCEATAEALHIPQILKAHVITGAKLQEITGVKLQVPA